MIPRNVRIGEAPSYGRPVIHHDPHCSGSGRLLRACKGGRRTWLNEEWGAAGRDPAASRRGEESRLHSIPLTRSRRTRGSRARRFGERAAGLADSIGQRGVLQPVLVRPARRRALRADRGRAAPARRALAGLERIPALVRTSEDDERLELALIENMAREDLNPVEAARACAALVDELGFSKEEVGRRLGRSRVRSRTCPPARAARRRARDARARRAVRRPRPRDAAGARPGDPALARARRAATRPVGPGDGERARATGSQAAARAPSAPRPARTPSGRAHAAEDALSRRSGTRSACAFAAGRQRRDPLRGPRERTSSRAGSPVASPPERVAENRRSGCLR